MFRGKMENLESKRIKEVQVNQSFHRRVLGIWLIIFGVLLLGALSFLIATIRTWYVIIVAVCLLVFCVWRGIETFKKSKNCHKYVIYEDKLTVNSVWYDYELKLSEIFMVEPIITIFDKILKKKSSTIVIYSKESVSKKIFMTYIAEDTSKLCEQIMKLSVKARKEKTKINKESLVVSNNSKNTKINSEENKINKEIKKQNKITKKSTKKVEENTKLIAKISENKLKTSKLKTKKKQ